MAKEKKEVPTSTQSEVTNETPEKKETAQRVKVEYVTFRNITRGKLHLVIPQISFDKVVNANERFAVEKQHENLFAAFKGIRKV